MRELEFKEWLRNQGYKESTVTTFTPDALRVERVENTDLDEEFQKDGLKRLIDLYTYSTQDQRNNRPNPTNMNGNTTSLSGFLASYKGALKQYSKFCENNKTD